MNRTAFFFALIFTFVGFTAVQAQDLKAIVDETLIEIPPGDGSAAMVIAISRKGKMQYFSFGSQEGLGKKVVDENQLFELGMATGVFTSTLMLLEAQKGAFLPEDRVVNYLPEGMTLPLYEKYNCMDIPISGRLPGQRFQGISTASICRPAEGSPFCISFCDLASHTSGLSDIKGTYQFNPLREKAYSATKPKYLSVDKVMHK
ncbi:MAG: serine hydrolase, partial [Bacteroidota bacterium]